MASRGKLIRLAQGLINPCQVVVRTCGDGYPAVITSLHLERAEEALASTVRGFFLCRYDPLGRVFLGWQLHHYGDCHAKPNQSQCS